MKMGDGAFLAAVVIVELFAHANEENSWRRFWVEFEVRSETIECVTAGF